MAKRQTETSQKVLMTIGVTLGVVLSAAAALHAVSHWRQLVRGEQRRVFTSATLLGSQVAPLLRRRINEPLHQWARTIKAESSVCLVAVHDKTSQLRAIEADSPLLARRAVWSKDVMAGLHDPIAWRLTDDEGHEVYGAMVPICSGPNEPSLGQLTLALRTDVVVPFGALTQWGFYLPLLAATIFAWRLGHWQIIAHVVEPFRDLAHRVSRGGRDLPVHRGDSLGLIAKEMEKLHCQIDHWRQHVRDLEATLDKKVESQTKGYLKEIRKIAFEIEIDPLTGLKNRRVIETHFERLVDDHIQRHADMAVIMVDLDNFKTFNDTLGHAAGDDLLSSVGELLCKGVREDDLTVRLGGDEFAIILPETGTDGAVEIARRLAALFRQMSRTLPTTDRPVSLSAGVAGLKMTGARTGKDLLGAADDALYKAKGDGKASVVVAQPVTADATA